ncbi:uncharacterized protein LOC108604336 [Drosophila busckii]|uniref:uncharacterized protein LOC108604336 n=1 Tax=Drosophila busckii TaxID=30019 RepID=UPI0014331F37|nr:uncharacterized protein LOC108604336 [Drosophila busckii]
MLLQTFTQLLLLLSLTALVMPASYLRDSSSTEPLPSSSSSAAPSTTTTTTAGSSGHKEEIFPAVAPVIETQPGLLPPALEQDDGVRRRVVTYDQRQEGQYNIRADLENFMIVLIPPGPQEGLSLLDLLTKSSVRGSNKRIQKRKHAHVMPLRTTPEAVGAAVGLPLPEFIEGRTPYHVDISASSNEQQPARLHRQQVDVLPPQLLPMPQLIKPFHLEAEQELIQALPPVTANSNGHNLLESFNQAASQYYRNSRALSADSFLETNRLPTDASSTGRAIQCSRSQLNNALYPPIDVPAYQVNEAQPRRWLLDEEPTPIYAKSHADGKDLIEADVLSFELLGDGLGESKSLLRDALARCAPGQRRDSYGACRQIEGY